jgi:hypothetical protein
VRWRCSRHLTDTEHPNIPVVRRRRTNLSQCSRCEGLSAPRLEDDRNGEAQLENGTQPG